MKKQEKGMTKGVRSESNALSALKPHTSQCLTRGSLPAVSIGSPGWIPKMLLHGKIKSLF